MLIISRKKFGNWRVCAIEILAAFYAFHKTDRWLPTVQVKCGTSYLQW